MTPPFHSAALHPSDVQEVTTETLWGRSGIVVVVGTTGAGKTALGLRLVREALDGGSPARFLVYTVWPNDWLSGLGSVASTVSLRPEDSAGKLPWGRVPALLENETA
jgi:GTPase SAR1 family protein